MDDLIDIYTRIKLRIDSDIIVTYYKDKCKITQSFILDDICEFKYIIGYNNDCDNIKINFFSNNMIIETIKVYGSNVTIYNNPYINDNLVDDDSLLDIQNKMIGNHFDDIDFLDKFLERDNIIDKYINRDSTISYEQLFFSDKQKAEFEVMFNMIVDELSMFARCNDMDDKLEFISAGTTSLVYQIGDKIIKIGKTRRCNYIPYCEYILQPIINRTFDFDGYPIHIEITQKIYTLENKDGCAIYSDDCNFNDGIEELRNCLWNIGISSRDLNVANIGILLDDNIIHYNNMDFDINNDLATSIERNNNLRILGKGRFVIIDLDCLKIDNIDKYMDYLKFIGYKDITYDSKCLVRK